jgi:hypothetical protein
MIYGTATFYRHLRFEPPAGTAEPAADAVASARAGRETAFLAGLDVALAGARGGAGTGTGARASGSGRAARA